MPNAPEHSKARKSGGHVVVAAAFTTTLVAGFTVAVSPLVGFVHATGFLAGLALWLARPMHATFASIKVPWLVALGTIAIHRTEEEVAAFVPAIEELAGRQAADATAPISILLGVFSLAWMLSPLLLRTGHPLGHFGAWSVFAGFGIVEPWHFAFPLFTPEPYGYFPGMLTAPLIIAAAWWGMSRLWRESRRDRRTIPVEVGRGSG